MIIKNTEASRKVRSVLSSLAIEEMFLDEEFVRKLMRAAEGRINTEELLKEVIRRHAG